MTMKVLAIAAMLVACASGKRHHEEIKSDYDITDRVFMDIEDETGKKFGRIVLGLFGNDVPVTVENFKQLSAHTPGFGYKGTPFHRVIKDFMVSSGDIVNGDGSGSKNIYGDRYFDDEHFEIKHFENALSMANIGTHTNGSQFLITTTVSPWLDGRHVVFGKLLEGLDVVTAIENVETDERDVPLTKVMIADCGLL